MKIRLYILFTLVAGLSHAQLNSTYQFSDAPASSWSGNPAFRGNEKFFIGFPALNALELSGAHTGFTFDQTVENETLQFQKVIEELDDVNHLMGNTRLGILNGGFRLGTNWHFRFGAQLASDFRIGYPKSLFELVYKGNGHPDIIGQNLDMSGLAFNSLTYMDYFVGGSRSLLDDRLHVGVNVHFLQGIAVAYTETSAFNLYTDPDSYAISLNGSYTYHTNLVGDSVTYDLLNDAEDFGDQFDDPSQFKPGRGAAIDFGVRYQLKEKIELQAAAMNVGAIKFDENVATYQLGNGSFTYNGVELEDFVDNPDSTESTFEALADSLSNAFTTDNFSEAFTVPTNARFSLGVNYEINPRSDINVQLAHLRSFNEGFNTVSAMYRRRFGRVFWVHGGIQMFQFTDPLIPAGFHLNLGPVQIGAGTTNLIAAIAPTKTGYFTGQFNLAFRFGRDSRRTRSAESSE